MKYLDALALIHQTLSPVSYVEIGCRHGHSLKLARCPAVAIDPEPDIRETLSAPIQLFRETSDHFFATHDLRALLGGAVDLAFVDGMHKAEFVLRDILNLESQAARNSVILVDDVLPRKIEWSTRERQTQAWTGDVYKVIPFLRKHRPDLEVFVFDIKIKGLAVISRLNHEDRSLQRDLARHEAALISEALTYATSKALRNGLAPLPATALAAHVTAIRDRRSAAAA